MLRYHCRLTTLALTLVFFGLGYGGDAHGQEQGDWPRLELSEDHWDFGDRDQGTRAKKTFVLKNTGKKALEIRRVGVTCGCLKLEMAPTTIKPGEERKLEVNLDLSQVVGKISKHVIIDSNSYGFTRCLIPIRGKSIPIWWLEPSNINFGRVNAGTSITKKFRLHIRPGLKLKIEKIKSSHALAKVTATPFGKTEEAHGYDIAVTLDPTIRPGPFRASISVTVKNDIKSFATVALHADVMGAIRVTPRRISFGGVSRGNEVQRELDIVKLRNKDLIVSRAQCSDPRVKLELEELEKGRRYRLYITFKAEGKSTHASGRIIIYTNDKDQPVLRVNYQGAIRP
ncbi:MAG: DUF1573 domain-containing protein [Planctomycetota bacterium]